MTDWIMNGEARLWLTSLVLPMIQVACVGYAVYMVVRVRRLNKQCTASAARIRALAEAYQRICMACVHGMQPNADDMKVISDWTGHDVQFVVLAQVDEHKGKLH